MCSSDLPPLRFFFLHNIIFKDDPLTLYLLFPDDCIAPLFKEWPCGNGSVSNNRLRFNRFQSIADSGGNPFSLIVLMNIQSVQIARFINIPKADDELIIQRNKSIVLPKRPIPSFRINRSRCPNS